MSEKKCERCNIEIPEDYQNLLCDNCYKIVESENLRLKQREDEEREAMKDDTSPEEESPAEVNFEPKIHLSVIEEVEKKLEEAERKGLPAIMVGEPGSNTVEIIKVGESSISDPNYQENPEMEDKEQWLTNITQFQKTGVLLYHHTRWMYEFIRGEMLKWTQGRIQWPKYIWGPMVVDVGCGAGVGTNVLSEEAQFAWGIDKNEKSIKFAKESFTRNLNRLYYSSELKFDQLDILEDTREFMKFDFIVSIETIEHIFDYEKFLTILTKKLGKPTSTWYISTPNRNNKTISNIRPANKYHIREWTSSEYLNVLSAYFDKVDFFSAAGEPIEDKENTTHTPILAKCLNPK